MPNKNQTPKIIKSPNQNGGRVEALVIPNIIEYTTYLLTLNEDNLRSFQAPGILTMPRPLAKT